MMMSLECSTKGFFGGGKVEWFGEEGEVEQFGGEASPVPPPPQSPKMKLCPAISMNYSCGADTILPNRTLRGRSYKAALSKAALYVKIAYTLH